MTNFLKEYSEVLIRSYLSVGEGKKVHHSAERGKGGGMRQAGITTEVEIPAVTELLLGVRAHSLDTHRYRCNLCKKK